MPAPTVTAVCYLIARKKRGYSSVAMRMTNKPPSLASGEVAIRVTLDLPSALFERPQLQATITIPASSVTPPVLDALVMDNVREVLMSQTGMDVRVSLVEPEAA